MTGWEAAAVWAAIALYAAAWIVHMTGLVFKQDKLQAAGSVLAGSGLAAHTAAVAARWVATGHAPVVGNYENALAGTWAVVLALWALARRRPALWAGEAVVLPLVLLTLGYGLLRSPVPTTLTPAYQSPWLFVHVLFAWLGYAAFTVAAAVGVLYLCKHRRPAGERWARLPALEELDL
ncbi:MAG: cytochrome c biogenesis protein CcsA, partial [Bacillota bacterium]|nr:cytochrome c biogenesis protein CcsA [Bacillota bacterium]